MLARSIALALFVLAALPARAADVDPALQARIDAPLRSEKNRARDPYRLPPKR
jgi:hypothetical protein